MPKMLQFCKNSPRNISILVFLTRTQPLLNGYIKSRTCMYFSLLSTLNCIRGNNPIQLRKGEKSQNSEFFGEGRAQILNGKRQFKKQLESFPLMGAVKLQMLFCCISCKDQMHFFSGSCGICLRNKIQSSGEAPPAQTQSEPLSRTVYRRFYFCLEKEKGHSLGFWRLPSLLSGLSAHKRYRFKRFIHE